MTPSDKPVTEQNTVAPGEPAGQVVPAPESPPAPEAAPAPESTTAPEAGPAQASAPAGEAGQPKKLAKSTAREWAETLVVALLVALVIRTFGVQVYMVEGPSMEPTLHTYERVFVNKLLYRFRPPQPGEIIVLQDPSQPGRELIKRVIAVGGETVEVKKGVTYINGQPLNEPFINTAIRTTADMPPQQVPANDIFVMGDNRAMSFDSRAMGPIPLDKVDGKAFFMFWPIDRFAYGPLDQPRQVAPSLDNTK